MILSLPQGAGKTTHAEALRDFFGCASIVDEWPRSAAIRVGALHLTNAEVPA